MLFAPDMEKTMKQILFAVAFAFLANSAYAEPLVLLCDDQYGSVYITKEDDPLVRKLGEWHRHPGTNSRIVLDGEEVKYFLDTSKHGMVSLLDFRRLYGAGYDRLELVNKDESDNSFMFTADYENGLGVINVLVTGLETEKPMMIMNSMHNTSQYPTAAIFKADCAFE